VSVDANNRAATVIRYGDLFGAPESSVSFYSFACLPSLPFISETGQTPNSETMRCPSF
jgi:hypothetical protein